MTEIEDTTRENPHQARGEILPRTHAEAATVAPHVFGKTYTAKKKKRQGANLRNFGGPLEIHEPDHGATWTERESRA